MKSFGDLIRADDWWQGPPSNPLEVYWPFESLRKTEMAIVVGDCIPEINELLCLAALENHHRGVRVSVGSCSSYGNWLIRHRLRAYKTLFRSEPDLETDPDTLAWLIKNDHLSEMEGWVKIVANIDKIAELAEMSVLQLLLKIHQNCVDTNSVAIVSVSSGHELPEFVTSLTHIEKVGNSSIKCISRTQSGSTISYVNDLRCGPYIGNTQQLLSKAPPEVSISTLHSDIEAQVWDSLDQFLTENMHFVQRRMGHRKIDRIVTTSLVRCECSRLYPIIIDDHVSFIADFNVWFGFSQNYYLSNEHAFIHGLISGEAHGSIITIDSLHTLFINRIR